MTLSKNVFFLTNFEGLSYQIYVYVYYAIFDLLNFRSNYFAYFYNTYLSSSWCLIEWSIFLPASKATDGWLRKGKKGSHKTTFLTEKTVFEEEKDVWMRWEGEDWWGVFFQYFGVKNHAFSMDIRWTFFKIFFVKFTPLYGRWTNVKFFSAV